MGANQMILGSYVESGRQFRLTVNMYDTHDLARLWRDEATGPVDSLFALVDRLAARAATALCGQPEYNPAQLCFDVAARPRDSISVTATDEAAPDGSDAGAVSFYARVTPEGQLADVRFRSGASDEELAGRALAALRGARFTPARKAGRAVEAWTTVDVPVLVTASAAATATPSQAPAGDPRCAQPEFGARNEGQICFEERPVPLANLPVVRVPVACPAPPSPATVLIRVTESGEVAETPSLKTPSSCAAFDSAATAAAAQIVFSPAVQHGQPVAAWTYVRVVPAPPAPVAPGAPRPTTAGRRIS
jgi:hypothetical protein